MHVPDFHFGFLYCASHAGQNLLRDRPFKDMGGGAERLGGGADNFLPAWPRQIIFCPIAEGRKFFYCQVVRKIFIPVNHSHQ